MAVDEKSKEKIIKQIKKVIDQYIKNFIKQSEKSGNTPNIADAQAEIRAMTAEYISSNREISYYSVEDINSIRSECFKYCNSRTETAYDKSLQEHPREINNTSPITRNPQTNIIVNKDTIIQQIKNVLDAGLNKFFQLCNKTKNCPDEPQISSYIDGMILSAERQLIPSNVTEKDRADIEKAIQKYKKVLLERYRTFARDKVITHTMPTEADLSKIFAKPKITQEKKLRENWIESYTSFSGCDMLVDAQIWIDKERCVSTVMGSLATISYSIFQQKFPINAIGNVNAKDYVMGPRTIAGSLVFIVFNQHWATELLRQLSKALGWPSSKKVLVDEIPPIDLTVSMGNEYGFKSRLAIYGVRLFSEGQVMSINDMYTENTYQYVALNVDYLTDLNGENPEIPVNTTTNPESIGVDLPTTATPNSGEENDESEDIDNDSEEEYEDEPDNDEEESYQPSQESVQNSIDALERMHDNGYIDDEDYNERMEAYNKQLENAKSETDDNGRNRALEELERRYNEGSIAPEDYEYYRDAYNGIADNEPSENDEPQDYIESNNANLNEYIDYLTDAYDSGEISVDEYNSALNSFGDIARDNIEEANDYFEDQTMEEYENATSHGGGGGSFYDYDDDEEYSDYDPDNDIPSDYIERFYNDNPEVERNVSSYSALNRDEMSSLKYYEDISDLEGYMDDTRDDIMSIIEGDDDIDAEALYNALCPGSGADGSVYADPYMQEIYEKAMNAAADMGDPIDDPLDEEEIVFDTYGETVKASMRELYDAHYDLKSDDILQAEEDIWSDTDAEIQMAIENDDMNSLSGIVDRAKTYLNSAIATCQDLTSDAEQVLLSDLESEYDPDLEEPTYNNHIVQSIYQRAQDAESIIVSHDPTLNRVALTDDDQLDNDYSDYDEDEIIANALDRIEQIESSGKQKGFAGFIDNIRNELALNRVQSDPSLLDDDVQALSDDLDETEGLLSVREKIADICFSPFNQIGYNQDTIVDHKNNITIRDLIDEKSNTPGRSLPDGSEPEDGLYFKQGGSDSNVQEEIIVYHGDETIDASGHESVEKTLFKAVAERSGTNPVTKEVIDYRLIINPSNPDSVPAGQGLEIQAGQNACVASALWIGKEVSQTLKECYDNNVLGTYALANVLTDNGIQEISVEKSQVQNKNGHEIADTLGLQPGDIVLWGKSTEDKQHAAIYIGDGKVAQNNSYYYGKQGAGGIQVYDIGEYNKLDLHYVYKTSQDARGKYVGV